MTRRAAKARASTAVARHAHNSAAQHWQAIRTIIIYLTESRDLGFVLFADADDADIRNERWWVLAVVVMLGNTAARVSSTTYHFLHVRWSMWQVLIKQKLL